MSKKIVTIRLEEKKNNDFTEICEKLNISKQQVVEKFIDNLITKYNK